MAAPAVSIIIPTWNRREMVLEALASVQAQTFPDFECLVVDDGSRDGTAEAVQALGDARIRCLVRPHRGIAATKNAGLEAAQGARVSFLDSDDLWLPGTLESQVRALEENPGAGLVYGRYRVERSGLVIRSRPARGPSGEIFTDLLRHIFIQTSTVCMPLAFARDLGGYDESYRYSDEYDFFLRAVRKRPALFLDCDLVRYRMHEGNESRDRFRQVSENFKVYTRFADDESLTGAPRRLARRRAARYAVLLGRAHLALGNREEARQCIRRALGYRPVYPSAWVAWLKTGGGPS